MRASRIVGALGRTLVAAGVLLLLFVAYQLWGTGLREAQAQDELRARFQESLAATTTTVAPTTVPDGEPAPPTTAPPKVPPQPPPPEGEGVAIIRIPRIGIEKVVVEGVGVSELKKGPGHYPGTPMPGQPGNAAIAGHRTTYGAPFYELQELEPGDAIDVNTYQGDFRYEVVETMIVEPDQVEVLAPAGDNRLTLTTCHPRYSARQRLVVVARLVGPPALGPAQPPMGSIPLGGGHDEPVIGRTPAAARAAPPPTFEEDALSGDRAARGPTVVWGSMAALVWLATWGLSREWRRWPAYVVGTPVFLAVLFTFYENVARLLPANI